MKEDQPEIFLRGLDIKNCINSECCPNHNLMRGHKSIVRYIKAPFKGIKRIVTKIEGFKFDLTHSGQSGVIVDVDMVNVFVCKGHKSS